MKITLYISKDNEEIWRAAYLESKRLHLSFSEFVVNALVSANGTVAATQKLVSLHRKVGPELMLQAMERAGLA